MTRRIAAGLAVLLAAGGWGGLREADPDVEQGNRAYREGRYDEALRRYQSAEDRGEDARLHFDKGTALYKLGEKSADPAEKEKLFQQAEEEFRRAADTDDDALKSSAYYNLGNAQYQRHQWEDAIASYKRALRADPKNDPARNNLEMALRQRQKQEQKQQQQKQQQKQQGGQKDQDPQPQGQGDPPPGQEPPSGQDGQAPPQPNPDGQAPAQPPGQGDQPPPGQGDQPPEPPSQPQGGQGQPDPKDSERQPGGSDKPPGRDEPGDDPADSESPSDQERKLDELERRSRDLRRRLLRQDGRGRSPQRLPSRRDW